MLYSLCTEPPQIVHADLWGPSPILSSNGFKYFMSFSDQYSWFTWLHLLKRKIDVITSYKHFKSLVELQLSKKIKCSQTDARTEFSLLKPILDNAGILFRKFCPYTSQQNGMVERKHRHLVEIGLTLLAQYFVPLRCRDYSFSFACHIINRILFEVLNHTSPFEKLFHIVPQYIDLKIFGCLCYPHVIPYNKHKLQFRSQPCTCLGYDKSYKGFVYLSKDVKIYINCRIVFYEHSFLFFVTFFYHTSTW